MAGLANVSNSDSNSFQQTTAAFLLQPGLPFAEVLSAERIERIFAKHGNLFGVGAIFSTAVAEQQGAEVLSGEVRNLVTEHVATWNGDDPGMSRHWVEVAVAGLSEPNRAAARLMLLTALASYQVDENVIREFRRHFPSDGQLIAATSWASFEATRRVSSWLNPVFEREEELLESVA